MRLYTFFLSALFFISIISCKEEINTTFLESDFNTEKHTNIHVNIPVATGHVNVSKKINAVITDYITLAFQIGETGDDLLKLSIEESMTGFTNEFNKFKKEFPETLEQWEAQIDGEVLFQSPEVISIALTSYINTGGAHGSLNISLINFDAETGEKIENNNLFYDLESFKKVAKIYFDKETKGKDLLSATVDFKLAKNIGYNNEGVILLYNTHEVAPYSTGIIEFVIPYEKINSYLVFNGSL